MLTIKEILSSDEYMIPMYQRNYSWEQTHLNQLIQDIWDSACLKSGRNYYIGTLVVHRREDGCFETVDGQQRLTTLNIVLCALKNEFDNKKDVLSWFKGVNISYEYRERSSKTLSALYEHASLDDLQDASITNMYQNVRGTIQDIVPQKGYDDFLEYLITKVVVTRVILPLDTDLNHYFEIMNSRGEQLEKHEILKARMMAHFSNNPYKSWVIGQIWEACSDMDRYVIMNFSAEMRNIIFSNEWNKFDWADLDNIIDATRPVIKNVKDEQFSILDVLNESCSNTIEVGEIRGRDGDRFESVLKFPGFLLQVLRIMTQEDIPLDDKRLLDSFEPHVKDSDFVNKFLLKMLELRYLYDMFVIKRDYKDNVVNGKMNLLRLVRQQDSFSYNNTFVDGGENRRAIMAESMFHVSLPSQNYKHWLCAVLNYVNKHKDGEGLASYLEHLAKTYMLGRFLNNESDGDGFYYKAIFHEDELTLSSPEEIEFPNFIEHIDFFIFNYIDYCIWRDDPNSFAQFEFTSRSSVEHFYPQNPLSLDNLEDDYLHNIGNLCLISASRNSELSNYSPLAKTEHYEKTSSYDSLKQKMMMDIVRKKSQWSKEEIVEHYQTIKTIVKDSFSKM